MAIAPESPETPSVALGLQINNVWMGAREASNTPGLEPWVAAVVIYLRVDGGSIACPLTLDQATQMRDRLLVLAKGKPKTAGERYAANKARIGLSFKFDHDTDGIFLADRSASPSGLPEEAVGSISFKAFNLDGIHCNALTAFDCAAFGETLVKVLQQHVEPPEAEA